MNENFTSIYLPMETYEKLKRLQTKLDEIIDKKTPLYQVIEILIALQLNEI